MGCVRLSVLLVALLAAADANVLPVEVQFVSSGTTSAVQNTHPHLILYVYTLEKTLLTRVCRKCRK